MGHAICRVFSTRCSSSCTTWILLVTCSLHPKYHDTQWGASVLWHSSLEITILQSCNDVYTSTPPGTNCLSFCHLGLENGLLNHKWPHLLACGWQVIQKSHFYWIWGQGASSGLVRCDAQTIHTLQYIKMAMNIWLASVATRSIFWGDIAHCWRGTALYKNTLDYNL